MTMTEKKSFQAINSENELSDTEQNTEQGIKEAPAPETAKEATEELLQKEINDLKDQLLRALAEAENARKRAQKDREEALQYAIANFAREMLSVQDNLQRALESVKVAEGEKSTEEHPEQSQKALLEGVTITAQDLAHTLDKYGIKEINPLHTPFDSNFHQAMFEEETNDHAPGTVTQVLQIGYTLKERLLRPAMVGVSKKKN
jgi:molecular chaperone GrpE